LLRITPWFAGLFFPYSISFAEKKGKKNKTMTKEQQKQQSKELINKLIEHVADIELTLESLEEVDAPQSFWDQVAVIAGSVENTFFAYMSNHTQE
jgi:hypothetical protein